MLYPSNSPLGMVWCLEKCFSKVRCAQLYGWPTCKQGPRQWRVSSPSWGCGPACVQVWPASFPSICTARAVNWGVQNGIAVLYLFLMYLMITQQHPKKDGPRYHNSDVAFVLLLLFCNCGTRSDHQPTTTTHYGLGELFSNMLKKKWWILILNVEVDVAPGYCGVRRIVVW